MQFQSKSEQSSSRKRSNILQNETDAKRKREPDPESASGESDSESLLDEADSNSPATNPSDEKNTKSETARAASLLPVAENSNSEENDQKMETEPILTPSAVYPLSSSPNTSNNNGGGGGGKETAHLDKSPLNLGVTEEGSSADLPKHPSSGLAEPTSKDQSVESRDLPLPLSKPYADYEGPSVAMVKNEGLFDSPSPDRDEILPPVLTSEESYVPKDEMPTLHASTSISDTIMSSASYSSDMAGVKFATGYPPPSQMEVAVDTIKMEPGIQSGDENNAAEAPKPPISESPLQRSESPSFSRQPPSPPASMPYSHIPPESPRQSMEPNPDKPLPQPVMLPAYMYNESDRSDKGLGPGVPPGALNLAHHPAYAPYYHFPPHPSHADKLEGNPYLGMCFISL